MKKYSYFPGCSCSAGSGQAYSLSALAVAKVLDLEFKELEDWNCCGSTPLSSSDEFAMVSLSARNLALAEKQGWDVVTPCSSCFVTLNWSNTVLKKHLKKILAVKPVVDEILAAAGLKYDGTINVRHLLDILVNDVSREDITSRIKVNLKGLKVAPYYGCQVVRPDSGLDHPENPLILDKLLSNLGADVGDFASKTACCGSSLALSDNAKALEFIRSILEDAASGGANCIITVCPLCQMNLDVYQDRVNKKYHTHYHIPVLYFTQLMGIAFGLNSQNLGLNSNIVSAQKMLAAYL